MGGLFSKADDSDDDVESTHESEGDEEERDGETNHESAGDQDAHVWHDGVDAATLDENDGEMPSAGAFEALEETDLAVLGEVRKRGVAASRRIIIYTCSIHHHSGCMHIPTLLVLAASCNLLAVCSGFATAEVEQMLPWCPCDVDPNPYYFYIDGICFNFLFLLFLAFPSFHFPLFISYWHV